MIGFLLATSVSLTTMPSENFPVENARHLLTCSILSEDSCLKLVNELKTFDEKNNPVLAGYRACATMIRAKYTLNPYRKLAWFSEGRYLLERCIDMENQNAELRFLRFSVQCNAPFFLMYRNSLNSDKIFLMNSIDRLNDAQLRQLIISFLIESKQLSNAELNKMRHE